MEKVSLRVYNHEIESMIEGGRLDEAVAHCRHILESFPMHVETYRLLGKAFLEARRYVDAADIFQRVLMAVPDDFVSQVGMSIIRDDEGRVDAAIWHMERAFEVQPSNSAIQGELRRLYGRRDGVEPSKIRLSRDALANMYTQGELFDQAIAEIRSILAGDPDRPDMQVMLMRAFYRSGKKGEAAEIAATLLKKYPNCIDALRLLVDIDPGNENIENTRIFLHRLSQLDPDSFSSSDPVSASGQPIEAAADLERLDYGSGLLPGSVHPDWTSSLGIKLNSEENDEPANVQLHTKAVGKPEATVSERSRAEAEPALDAGSDSLPEWMRFPGQLDSTGEGKEKPDTGGVMQPEEPSAKAEIPVWLMSTAPSESLDDKNKESNESIEGMPVGEHDIPDWLKSTTPHEATEKTQIGSLEIAGSLPENADESISSVNPIEAVSVTPAEPDASGEAQPAKGANIPEWLKSAATPVDLGDGGMEPRELDVPQPVNVEDVPDFLKSLAQTEPVSSEAGSESIPAEIPSLGAGAFPDWLDEVGAGTAVAVSPFAETMEHPGMGGQAISGQPATDQEEMPPSEPPSEATAQPAVQAGGEADTLAWLDRMSSGQGTTPEGLMVSPDEKAETIPEANQGLTDTQPVVRKVEESVGMPTEFVEPVKGKAPAEQSIEEKPAVPVEELPVWLRGFESHFKPAEALNASDDFPEWLLDPIVSGGEVPHLPEGMAPAEVAGDGLEPQVPAEPEPVGGEEGNGSLQPMVSVDMAGTSDAEPEPATPEESTRETGPEPIPAETSSSDAKVFPDWMEEIGAGAAVVVPSVTETMEQPGVVGHDVSEQPVTDQPAPEQSGTEALVPTPDQPIEKAVVVQEEIPPSEPPPETAVQPAVQPAVGEEDMSAWLERMSAGQGTTPEEPMLMSPEERAETIPEVNQGLTDTQPVVRKVEESVDMPTEFVEPVEEVKGEAPAEQPIEEKPAVPVEELPDWLIGLENPSTPDVSFAASDDLPEWLRHPLPSEEPVRTSEAEVPDWVDENIPVSGQAIPTMPEEWVPAEENPDAGWRHVVIPESEPVDENLSSGEFEPASENMPVTEPVSESVPGTESEVAPVTKPVDENLPTGEPEPFVESVSASEPAWISEPSVEPKPTTESEVDTQTKMVEENPPVGEPELAFRTMPEIELEPVAESMPALEPALIPEPPAESTQVTESETASEGRLADENLPSIEPETGSETMPVIEPGLVAEPIPVGESIPVSEPEGTSEPPVEPFPVPESETVPGTKMIDEIPPMGGPEPVSETTTEIEPEPAAESTPVADLESVSETGMVEETPPAAESEPVLETISVTEPVHPFEPTPVFEPKPASETGLADENLPAGEPEPASETIPVTEPEPIAEPTLETGFVPVSEPALIPEPPAEPIPVAESSPELEPEPASESIAASEPAGISEPPFEPSPVAEPESAFETVLVDKNLTVGEPPPAVETMPETEPEPIVEPTLEAGPEPALIPEPSGEPMPVAESEPEAEARLADDNFSEVESEPVVEAMPAFESEWIPEFPVEPTPVTEPEPPSETRLADENLPAVEPASAVETIPEIEPEPVVESMPALESEWIPEPPVVSTPVAESEPASETKLADDNLPAVEPAPAVETIPDIEPEPFVESMPAIEPEWIPESPVESTLIPASEESSKMELVDENPPTGEPGLAVESTSVSESGSFQVEVPGQSPAVRETDIIATVPILDKDAELLSSAQAVLENGSLDESMKLYSKLIKKGRLLDDVIHDLREAIHRYPLDLNTWQTLGDAYMRASHLQDALDAYTRAEELLR
jgi:tetratricopeptide (TPR) repeat protein